MEEDDAFPLREDLEGASEVDAVIEVLLQSADQGLWWELLRSPDDFCQNVLQVAASRGKTDVLEVLLAAGAPVEADGRSALVSAMSSKSGDTAELLLSLGGDRYFCDRQSGDTPMLEACAHGREGLLCLLMAGNSPDEMVTAPPGSPWTGRIPALLEACSWGNVAAVEALLQAGVSSESTAQVLWNCVADPRVVPLLIRVAPVGAELEAVLPSRVRHCKTIAGAVHILNDPRVLVETSGSPGDLWNNFLLLSYQRRYQGMIELALMCGGDTRTEESRDGLCPLHLARDVQMVELLVCSGANVDATASRRTLKDSVLSWACRKSPCAVVELLLSCGATPTDHTFTWISSRRESCDLICSLLPFATASHMEYLAERLHFPQDNEALDLLLRSPNCCVLPTQLPDLPLPDSDTIPSECLGK